ncbi:ATP-binding cassette (ABC) Superfamily [Phytophthora palmivora]|uniref:ATP-binding cassette (ABC) Superfamily n=1 Tax=Phytophthora palmivora TaxID=4796 RepID=A0A2P4YM14_9STRA|nr:ATP-binding cassette (ABC) Superfamily [Phytophthora palmivora]
MAIDEFVCNPAEVNTEMETLTIEEILNETTDSTFLDTTEGDSLEDDDDNVEDKDFMQISTEDKVITVRNIIALLVDHPDVEERLLKDLRKVQTRVRDEMRVEKANRTKQTSIDGFFQSAYAKSKDKATPRKEARKTASKAASKLTNAAATQGGSPRHSRSRSLSPDDRPNPRFAYRDHSAESPDFDIPMITGSESDEDTIGSTKDPTPAQDAPSQDAPVGDSESSEAKAASTSSPTKNLTLDEARSPDSPSRESGPSKGYQSLFDPSSDEVKKRGPLVSLKRSPMISMSSRSAIKLFNCKALLRLPRRRTSRGAYERTLVQDEPLFINDIEAARCVLLAPHRIPLKEFTSLRKKPEDRGGLFHVWGYPWVQPENTTIQTQAEDLF